jgi:3-deoxy-D-manno-octulosonic-acid transferase
MRLIYDIFLFLYNCGIHLASLFHAKAREWVIGRRNWQIGLKTALAGKPGKRLWMHCASLGEFEQGRPVLEAWRRRNPEQVIVLTFFSPSGYKHQKAAGLADVVAYLPLDGPKASREFVDLLDPGCVLFVKYEFWHYYSMALFQRQIPLFCISAIFRPGQIFFRPYGSFFLRILKRYTCLFVQDEDSFRLLRSHGIADVLVTGDTRFDRVIQNAGRPFSHPVVEAFCHNRPVLVAGSTWPADEELLNKFTERFPDIALIIAPHEIGDERLDRLSSVFGPDTIRLSKVDAGSMPTGIKVLIVDSIGMLSSLYRYGKYAYVGGGFGAGIHNTLEAAVYGVPVFFGPHYSKFREAVVMVDEGCAFSVDGVDSLASVLSDMEEDAEKHETVSRKAARFVEGQAGATDRIMDKIIQSVG